MAVLTPTWMENQGMVMDIYHAPSDTSVAFKLFLTAFEDTFIQNWNDEVSIGRNDPHLGFKNTARTITVSLDVPTESIEDSYDQFLKLSKLIQMQYPTYGNASNKGIGFYVIKGSPIFRIKLLNWIMDATAQFNPKSSAKESGLYCTMGGVSFSPNLTEGVYHNEANEVPGLPGAIYPKLFTLSFSLKILHKHPLGYFNSEPRAGGFPYGERDEKRSISNNSTNSTISSAQANKILSGG
jgi:hypothetical protein